MNKVVAIVPAAGESSRMRGLSKDYQTKILMPLGEGLPLVLEASIKPLLELDEIKEIIIAVSKEIEEKVSQLAKQILIECKRDITIRIVPGGETRQESVWNAIQTITDSDAIVLVHDAARPCCPKSYIKKLIDEMGSSKAAILATPVRSTLKRIGINNEIVETVSRESVWEAQTPQAFHFRVLKAAHERARSKGKVATDDSTLVESCGQPVKVIEGTIDNIKITHPEDLTLASRIYSSL